MPFNISSKLLAEANATIVYNPTSNMALGSGVCPILDAQKLGVNIAFGTDSSASNWSSNVLEQLSHGALIQKLHHLDPTVIKADQILHMATIGGARALGMEHQIGSLEGGKKADIITIDLRQPHLQPVRDPVSMVVYGASGTDVSTVIVDGQIILNKKEFTILDQDTILKEAAQTAMELESRVKDEIGNF